MLGLMRNITAHQQWGRAADGNTAQWAVGGCILTVTISPAWSASSISKGGSVGVAIAATLDAGTFATATSLLNNHADWITPNSSGRVIRNCSTP
ncbi:hypothetical protein [Mycobacterium sp. DBP42]|uniref:hypothetical protein n=1 Tax=Mycobacterium sp. DBP42 TaxID=2545267 RepID=UPI00104213C1|nr:hypothetical protein [Mycobacterium sp. DBP42]TMS50388.1 hypothetical protein E0T84_24060 [Mycobacterium sp. DBP42]